MKHLYNCTSCVQGSHPSPICFYVDAFLVCVCVGSACFKLVRRVLIYDPPSFLSSFTKRLPLKMYQLSSTSLEEIRQWVSNGFHISDTLKLIFFALKNDVEREKISKRMENWNLPLEYRAYLMPIPLNISTGHAYTIILFFSFQVAVY